MIPDPPPNTRAHPYRGLSVQETDLPLTEAALVPWLVGREVYRRTEYLALRNGDQAALLAVRKASLEPLFSPVVEARFLAGPGQVVQIVEPDADAGNATALASAARSHAQPSALAYLVTGRYEHVNFIWRPDPVQIRVVEVVPPHPAKLADQARRAVEFDEDLPPVDLVLDTVSISVIAAQHPAGEYLLPCRGSGVDLPGTVTFLDTRPERRGDWLLIGCERSLQFHRHFYGDEPRQVDLCPLRRVEMSPSHGGRYATASPGTAEKSPSQAPAMHISDGGGKTLVKCCLRERGVEVDGEVAIVPWGASIDEVREALRLLAGVDTPSAVSSGVGS